MKSRQYRKFICAAVLGIFVITGSTPAFAFDSAIVRSVLLPGSGQAHQGHYTKAALFAGAAIISGVGLFASQIHYDQVSDDYVELSDTYAGYEGRLESGEVISIGEINGTYNSMTAAFDSADHRLMWRNSFLTALIATYALNLVDVLMSDPDSGEIENVSGMSVEMRGTDVMLVKSFSF